MKMWKTAGIVTVAAALAFLAGCKKETPRAEPAKTAAELKAEAEKQINAENLSAELDKMEKEVDSDIATEE